MRVRFPGLPPNNDKRCFYQIDTADWKPEEGFAYDSSKQVQFIAKVRRAVAYEVTVLHRCSALHAILRLLYLYGSLCQYMYIRKRAIIFIQVNGDNTTTKTVKTFDAASFLVIFVLCCQADQFVMKPRLTRIYFTADVENWEYKEVNGETYRNPWSNYTIRKPVLVGAAVYFLHVCCWCHAERWLRSKMCFKHIITRS